MIYKNVIPDYDFVPVLVCLERGAKNVIKDKTHAHTHTHTYELKKKNFKRGEDTKLRR